MWLVAESRVLAYKKRNQTNDKMESDKSDKRLVGKPILPIFTLLLSYEKQP
ncbi:MAG TPA: hypothetical protein VIX37_15540 [Candidatus Sulfotelmatobacter sp.]